MHDNKQLWNWVSCTFACQQLISFWFCVVLFLNLLNYSWLIHDSETVAILQMPSLNSDLLKQSGIGKAVMMLYRHPKETRKNKERAGKLISKLI